MIRNSIAALAVAFVATFALAPAQDAHACGGYGGEFFLEIQIEDLRASRTQLLDDLALATAESRDSDIDALLAELALVQQDISRAQAELEQTRAERVAILEELEQTR